MDFVDFSLVCQYQCYEGVFLPVARPANQYDTIAELTSGTVRNDLPPGREWSGMGVLQTVSPHPDWDGFKRGLTYGKIVFSDQVFPHLVVCPASSLKLKAGFEKPWRKPQPGFLTSQSAPSGHYPGTPRVDPEPGGCTSELRVRPATGQPRQRRCPQHRPIFQMLPGHLPTAQKTP